MSLEQKVSDYLTKWANQLKEAKRSHFRVSAVKKASDVVLTVPLKALVDADSLKSIKGIGPEIEAVIKEIVSTGKCVEIDAGTSGTKPEEATTTKTKPIFYWWHSDKQTKIFEDMVGEGVPVIVVTPATQFDRTGYLCDGGCDTKKEEKELADTYKILEGLGFDVDISGCEGNRAIYNNGDEKQMLKVLANLTTASKNAKLGKMLEESYAQEYDDDDDDDD